MADKVAEVEVLTLSKKLGEKMAHTLHHTRLGLSMVGTLPNVHVEEKAYTLRNPHAQLQAQALLKKLV